MLPRFAKPIAEARRAGKRPADLVIVSDGQHGLHRRFPANPVVLVENHERPGEFDWRFLAGLDVEIATDSDYRRTMSFVLPILDAKPDYLRIWRMHSGRLIRICWLGIMNVRYEDPWVCADAAY